ncbi:MULTISPECIES: LysR family transcriptional regulator [unclassified Hyphomicrobium]|uniref:LysR family transcriptional regulator n=1 Tax=unclassified Hyphomicrobium TaxID=2619925 RepID=UPI000213E67D|nr:MULTISPECIES: LysR family transcriptional regulator [unclassified Hyphomicrobium]CCB65935.1 Putative transcriptional regulator, LysR family [Hyphomicrobium sp. MC1]
MFVRQMSYLVALAREKHFTRAAEKCHVTQSTLSAGLKALERELDMRLVLRGPRFIGLTPEGERVVAWASQIISDYENLKQDVAGLREGLKGTLRLGVIPAAMPAVAKLTSPFCAQHPGITVDVFSMTSAEIQAGIDKFELDAGLTYLENEPLANVRKTPLYRERYFLVTHVDSPLAQTDAISWKEAVTENLCLLNESMQNRRVLNKLAESLGLKLAPSVTSNSYLAICSHVCSGEWSSIIPHTFSYIFCGCKELALVELVDPKHSQSIGLVASNRDPLSPLAHALIRCASRLNQEDLFAPALVAAE